MSARRPYVAQANRASFEDCAAPEAIAAALKATRNDLRSAQDEEAWLMVLFARRCRQVAAGHWPPAPEPDGQVR
jgi:hypothetical protein